MEIDLREPVKLGMSTQWIRIRAADARNPPLLLVQHARGRRRVLDGRGDRGASRRAPAGPGGDPRHGKHGHRRRSRREERLRIRARRRAGPGETQGRSAAQGDRAGPHPEPAGFAARVRWAANFGGVRPGHTYNSMARGLLASLLRSPDYSPADAIRAIRGITATQAALLPELESLNLTDTLPGLDCPIVMVQGRHDQVAPGSAAERYAESLKAPSKQFVWFEHSAHLSHLEEPGRFREVLAKVRLSLPANS